MQTLFIIEYQAYNDGTASALPPLGYQVTDMDSEAALISAFFGKCTSAAISACDTHTVMIVNSEGEVWRGYRQVLRHGHSTPESD